MVEVITSRQAWRRDARGPAWGEELLFPNPGVKRPPVFGAAPADREMGLSPTEAPSSALAPRRLGLISTWCFSSLSDTL